MHLSELTFHLIFCKKKRAEKRLLKLEAERVAEIASLEQGSTSCPVGGRARPPPPTAVAELEMEVSRLRSELATTRTTPPADQPGDQPAKKPRLCEDFVPNTVEEAGLWLKYSNRRWTMQYRRAAQWTSQEATAIA